MLLLMRLSSFYEWMVVKLDCPVEIVSNPNANIPRKVLLQCIYRFDLIVGSLIWPYIQKKIQDVND